MPYVSCKFAPPLPPEAGPPPEDGKLQIVCIDEEGLEWSLTEDSQVGDYLRFVEAGGQIEDADDPANN